MEVRVGGGELNVCIARLGYPVKSRFETAIHESHRAIADLHVFDFLRTPCA